MTKKIAVYGHYDSRGGTTAIEVSAFTDEERTRAGAEYDACFGWDADEAAPGLDPPSKEDWLGWATLDIGDFQAEGDLDNNEETWVIAKTAGENDDFVPDWEGVLTLRLVPAESEIPDDWCHPRWDDDAFSFYLGTGL